MQLPPSAMLREVVLRGRVGCSGCTRGNGLYSTNGRTQRTHRTGEIGACRWFRLSNNKQISNGGINKMIKVNDANGKTKQTPIVILEASDDREGWIYI